jgi:uncharacterized membrane protein
MPLFVFVFVMLAGFAMLALFEYRCLFSCLLCWPCLCSCLLCWPYFDYALSHVCSLFMSHKVSSASVFVLVILYGQCYLTLCSLRFARSLVGGSWLGLRK